MKVVNRLVKGKEYLHWSNEKNEDETVIYCYQRKTTDGKLLNVFKNVKTLEEVLTEAPQEVRFVH